MRGTVLKWKQIARKLLYITLTIYFPILRVNIRESVLVGDVNKSYFFGCFMSTPVCLMYSLDLDMFITIGLKLDVSRLTFCYHATSSYIIATHSQKSSCRKNKHINI